MLLEYVDRILNGDIPMFIVFALTCIWVQVPVISLFKLPKTFVFLNSNLL